MHFFYKKYPFVSEKEVLLRIPFYAMKDCVQQSHMRNYQRFTKCKIIIDNCAFVRDW